MTNQELKALCERVLSDYRLPTKVQNVVNECLRLLAENEAMSEVVEAAKNINKYWDQSILCHVICDPSVNFHEPECVMNRDLKAALSKLGGT